VMEVVVTYRCMGEVEMEMVVEETYKYKEEEDMVMAVVVNCNSKEAEVEVEETCKCKVAEVEMHKCKASHRLLHWWPIRIMPIHRPSEAKDCPFFSNSLKLGDRLLCLA
jgi:vacuolar-type H+-ATPase catalytic subunit A/Vma1